MLRSLSLAALLAAAAPAVALESGRPMTGAEFEAYTEGQTLTFGVDGVPYGIEQYLPGRRVLWSFIGEECREGTWFEAAPQICFVYDDEPARLHCWTFYDTGNGLRARFGDDPDGTELIEVLRSPAPMMCRGPMLGA
jgi:hypothetical protein